MNFKLTVIILLASTHLLAQEIGSWNVLDVRKNTDKVISYQLEVQLRSLKFYHNFHYNEINFTANYKYNDNLVLSVLMGKHNTFSDGGDFMKPIVTDEFRQSLQAATVQRFGFISLDNRYRIEQRYFIDRNLVDYRMRYRFGLQASVSKSIKAQFSNEFFLAIGGSNSTFEKNRFLIGLKNTVNRRYEIQLNFLNQIDNRKNDESGSNFIQLVNIINI
ncbi:MAG: DUF2490 domain-containing protein [Cytophagales bacterium]|nr:DUF2490 domain-containing protein [Cytophagales bacterium]